MTKILAFDSMYLVAPIRKLYMASIGRILKRGKTPNNRLILYRLDEGNVLIREKQNISGTATELHKDKIDALSIEFYRHLGKTELCNGLTLKNIQIYNLYTRQVKLKLAGLLRCAYRIKKLSFGVEDELEIITDRQTVSIMKETFSFLKYEPINIIWRTNCLLTWFITINSLLMRAVALLKMIFVPSDLPKNYFYKYLGSDLPTVLITMPKRRPEDFFSTYVKKFDNQFNIILYSLGFMQNIPKNYKRIKIKQKLGVIRGLFNFKSMCFSAESYIADVLLIFKKHMNLSISIDIVNSVFSNKIDAHISRLQTNVVDNYFAIEAKRRGVFILGDLMEEIFYCDEAICPSASDNTKPFRLSLKNEGGVTYRGSNPLINYRLRNSTKKQADYLHCLLGLSNQAKLIFYASDPSKDESQRYLTEKFLIGCFSRIQKFCLVIKTHPQDNGRITNYAYLDSMQPSNVFLIGDITQKGKIASQHFNLFDNFDFNAAITSSVGFLTFSSSSVLQALMLGTKTGIVDRFDNGFYDYLVDGGASTMIKSDDCLQQFLEKKKLEVSDSILRYCGLKNDNLQLDIGEHLLHCMKEANKCGQSK